LQYPSLEDYVADKFYIGSTIGPFANRIRGGTFSIDDRRYRLEKNEGENTLHSGSCGMHNMVFGYKSEKAGVLLRRDIPDGTGGFPGDISITILFKWRLSATQLEIKYSAKTTKPTILNMTNHSYFNLSGDKTILSHQLFLRADGYTPADSEQLPTGEILPVKNTSFDFTSLRPIKETYDHNFALTAGNGPAAKLVSPTGDLAMDVFTDQPGIQLYTGTSLSAPFSACSGVCLETQHFPDSPNIPNFPSPIITPEKPYFSKTKFSFHT